MVTGPADRAEYGPQEERRSPYSAIIRERRIVRARVREFAHVDRTGDVCVAMPEQERDLIDTLAREQGTTRDGVPEAVH
jgi:hypothetical protein